MPKECIAQNTFIFIHGINLASASFSGTGQAFFVQDNFRIVNFYKISLLVTISAGENMSAILRLYGNDCILDHAFSPFTLSSLYAKLATFTVDSLFHQRRL